MPILPGLIANSGGSQPSPPTGLFYSNVTVNSFTLNWTPPDYLGKLTPIRYVISLYDSSGSLLNSSHKTVNYPASTVVVDGLAEGTTYSVRMRLENSSGIFSELSAPSANATTAVTPPPPPPSPPGSTWFCSYNGTDGRARTEQSSDLTDTSGCDYAVVCSTSGYPEYPGYVGCTSPPPPGEPTCTASCGSYSAFGGCTSIGAGGGVQYRTRTCTRTNCTTYTQTDSRDCCSQQCGAWSNWVGDSFGSTRSRTCQRSDCTTYTEIDRRCQSFTNVSCGACSRTRPFRQTCTTTTGRTDCTTSSTTSTRSC